MSIFRTGRAMELLFVLIGMAAAYYFLWSAIKGRPQTLRRMQQIVAIEEGVDRAVETGKPVYVSPAEMAYLSGIYSAMTLAGMSVVRYTTRMCVRKGAEVIIPVPYNPEAMPLLDGIYREACVVEGKPEAYKRENVMFFGTQSGIRALGEMGVLGHRGCAAHIEIGAWGGASAASTGYARELGGLVIAGTARYLHQGTIAMLSDYPLFMDEIFAAGAICSGDESVRSSMVGGDFVKVTLLILLLVFTVLAIAGQPVLSWIKM